MKLTFHGTRGEIDTVRRRDRRHSALEVAYLPPFEDRTGVVVRHREPGDD